jgi:hypothetical protein
MMGSMIGQQMARLSIGCNISGVIVIGGNPSRADKKDRLFDARGFQRLDQQSRPFVRLQKSAGTVRGIIKAEGNTIVGYGDRKWLGYSLARNIFRAPGGEQNNRQQYRWQE